MADAADDFWHFSLTFYEQPGMADLLVGLQDAHGVDVNLVLFLCWCGSRGRIPFDETQLSAARDSIAVWQTEVTAALREIRRRMKGGIATIAVDASEPLREAIKKLELESERIAQSVLAEKAPDVRAAGGPAEVIALLQMYFGALGLAESADIRAAVEHLAEACSPEA